MRQLIIINDKNVIIAPGQGKITSSSFSDKFCEEQELPCLLHKGKFGYNAPRNIAISPARYFNQPLLSFNQYFASDADYLFFVRSLYEQQHLRPSINFPMDKIRPGTLTAGMVKNNLKGTIERFLASYNAFSFMSSVKGTPAYWTQFLCDALAMLKPLAIPTSFFWPCHVLTFDWENFNILLRN